MSTITQTVASKAIVAFVAIAMIFTMFATPAQAQTAEDLQAQIAQLLEQINALQGQLGQGGENAAAGSVCPYTWTRDLTMGSTGDDVMKLQQFLNSDADTRVAAEGAGSVGAETMYYGALTAAAVSKMQMKYMSEILTPAGLMSGTGYFGPSSRAKANAVCATPAVTVPDTDEDDDATDEDEDEMDETVVLGGIASLDTFEFDGASNDEVEEGDNDVEVAEVTLEFTNGDAEVSIMDVSFAPGATDAWDVLENVSLWVDGEKVAELDASDEDDYLNEDDGTLRFTDLGLIAMEDEELEVVIGVSVRSSIDSADLGAYTVAVDSMRYFDADGVATTENDTGSFADFGQTETFMIEEAGFEDEILVRTSSNDPVATTLQLEDDRDSDFYHVFSFDIDTDDSINDIEINEIPVTVNLSSSTYNDIVDDAELVIDGVTIDDFTVTGGTTGVATLVFDVDGDVVIDAGDRVEAMLMLSFKALDAGNEGMTVDAEITVANVEAIEAEGADDLTDGTLGTSDQLDGSADSETHTLRTTGVDTRMTDDSAVVTSVDSANDYATYVIEVEVTAFEQDVYISTNPATSTAFALVDGAGATATTGTRSVVLSSTADENAGYFEINEGQTETVTLTVTYTPGVANTAARMVLQSLSFAETANDPTQTQTTLPATDYRTDVVTIVN